MENWNFSEVMVAGDMYVVVDSTTTQLNWHVNSWDMTEAITMTQKGKIIYIVMRYQLYIGEYCVQKVWPV